MKPIEPTHGPHPEFPTGLRRPTANETINHFLRRSGAAESGELDLGLGEPGSSFVLGGHAQLAARDRLEGWPRRVSLAAVLRDGAR